MCEEATATNPIDSPSNIACWLNISHELRTPANAILGHTELLLSGAMGPLSAEMRGSLGSIQQAGLDLMAQIDQAIAVGQKLPLPDLKLTEVDGLVDLLNDAWNKAEITEVAAGIPNGASCVQEYRPTHWFRVLALTLHSLEAKPSTSSRPDRSSSSLSVCEIDHTQTSQLVLEFSSCDRADFPDCVKIIEAALAMTGGTLIQNPGKLCLIWPIRT